MLIDQIRLSSKCGEIEGIIYKLIFLSSKGITSTILFYPSKSIIKYLKNEGFRIERLEYGIKVSW